MILTRKMIVLAMLKMVTVRDYIVIITVYCRQYYKDSKTQKAH